MTKEQIILLDELIEKGFITRKIELLDGRLIATLTSTTTADQLAVEGALRITESIPVHMIHNYQLKLMSRVLKSISYKNETVVFNNATEAEMYLTTRPPFIIDSLIDARSKFETEISELIKTENLDENFSKTPATDSDSK